MPNINLQVIAFFLMHFAKNTALFRQSITGWNFQNIAWINYIDEHITEDITPEMMAEHFNYSRDYFRKAFQDDFGMGLSAYISQRKIQKAARELRQGVKVASLAKKYGFKSRNGLIKPSAKPFVLVLPNMLKQTQKLLT